jgi:hypothetical protein
MKIRRQLLATRMLNGFLGRRCSGACSLSACSIISLTTGSSSNNCICACESFSPPALRNPQYVAFFDITAMSKGNCSDMPRPRPRTPSRRAPPYGRKVTQHCGGVRGEKKWERFEVQSVHKACAVPPVPNGSGAVDTIAIDHLSLESSSSTEPMNSIMFVESSQMEKKKNARLEDLLGVRVACRPPRGLASPAVVDWRM